MHTDNVRIAEWLGWTDIHISQQDGCMYAKLEPSDCGRYRVNGDFVLLDPDAIAILPVLVKKGYYWELFSAEASKGGGVGISVANPGNRRNNYRIDVNDEPWKITGMVGALERVEKSCYRMTKP